MPSVFVSGANGYIAKHVIVLLIKEGYTVVGTVRTEAKGELLKRQFGPQFTYEIVDDFLKEDAFDQALKNHPEVEGFFHTASPVSTRADDLERDIIRPGISGTVNVLKSIKRYGPQIKRFIFTSSFAAVITLPPPEGIVYTEDSWNPIDRNGANGNGQLAYCISKTYSEKAVWEFLEKEKPNFTVNVINPTYVFGPQAFDEDCKEMHLTAAMVGSLLNTKPNDTPFQLMGGFIDVRDVADAHIFAYKTETSGQRFLLNEETFSMQLFLNVIHENFNLDITKGSPENATDGFAEYPPIENGKTRQLLGSFIGIKQSIVDSVSQILKAKSS